MYKIAVSISFIALMANASPYTKADRMKDMDTLANAMTTIQQGFFYNDFERIKKGAFIVSDTIENVKPPLEEKEEKDMMKRYTNEKVKMTRKIVKKINKKAEVMIERYKAGDTIQALQAFTKITKECMHCHTQIRKW